MQSNERKRTYQCWSDMKQRCYNKNTLNYKNYGARGIVVCESWRNSFENFIRDMGEKPDNKTLDRVDSNGNYEPSNCRWASVPEQVRNRRCCVYLEHDGKRLTVEEWGRELGRHPTTIRSRVKAGWKLEDILCPTIQARGRCSKPREYAAMKEKP